MSASPMIDVDFVCRACQVWHPLTLGQQAVSQQVVEWYAKHRGHEAEIEVLSRKRAIPKGFDDRAFEEAGRAPWWLDFKANANIKLAVAASAAPTFTLASLASDTNLLAGRSSAAVSNTSNLYLDYLLGGKITTGTSPTASRVIEVWAWGVLNDTPLYPDTITGSDANVTLTTANHKASALRFVAALNTSSTSNVGYFFAPVSIASLFGGICPLSWGIWVVHNTGVNLNSTSGNHVVSQTGVYATSV